MPRERDPRRDKAAELYRESGGTMTNRQIAEILGVNEKVVAVWKQRDKEAWGLNVVQQSISKVVQQKKKRSKPGAPPGNKNARGNKGGGPPGNSKAVKHGFFRKYFPADTAEIIEQIQTESPIDILWGNIVIQYTAIVRAQQIMFVKDQDDMTKVLKRTKDGESVTEREWELQHAWDKQASFLQAQSRAMATLQGMIVRYDELCRGELATEEQRLRIDKLKSEVEKVRIEAAQARAEAEGTGDDEDDGFVEALNGKAAEVWGDGEDDSAEG